MIKKIVENKEFIIIHVNSKNITKFIIFKNIIIKELIKNYKNDTHIIIKLYFSKRRRNYDKITDLLLKNLKYFNNIIISKIHDFQSK